MLSKGTYVLVSALTLFAGCGKDGGSGSPADNPPVLISPGNKSVDENQPLSFTLSASDPDGNTIDYSMTGAPAGATMDPLTGLFNWTPSYTQAGVYPVMFTATANLESDSKSISITVNNVDRSPMLIFPGNKTVDEAQELTFTLSAYDSDGDSITYSMTTGAPAGATLDPTSGLFSWTPSYTQAGVYLVTFTATAGSEFDSNAISITANNVDRSPVLTSPGNKTVDEAQELTFTLSAGDPDGDSITYSMTGAPAGATLDPSSGLFSWTPSDTQSGSYDVIFTANANYAADSETVTITAINTVFSNAGGGVWSSYKKMTITNNSGAALTDYQVQVQPFRDTGDFRGDTISNVGLAGCWRFQEGAGLTAADSSDNANDGTLVGGASWTTWRSGTAVAFDGADGHVSVADHASLDLTTDISIECWVYFNSTAGNNGIVSKGPNSYIVGLYSTGKLTWGKWGINETLSAQTLVANKWYHVVVTRTAGVDSIYINGVLDNSAAKPDFENTASPLYIGSNDLVPGWYFDGRIDELKIYDRALTAEEVATHSGYAGRWTLDEGAGASAADSSGWGNNGTMTNGAAWTAGRFGNAVRCDGVDDYVSIPDGAAWDFGAGNFAVEFWFTVPDAGPAHKTMFASQNDFWLGMFVWNDRMRYFASSNGVSWDLVDGDTLPLNGIGSISITPNVWHHAVFTRNGNNWLGYIDGKLDLNVVAAGALVTRAEPRNLGRWGAGIYYLKGAIDEFRTYTRALAAEEVSARYGSGLVGSWHFSESAGTLTADSSGSYNEGTLVNGPARVSGRFGNALQFDGADDYVSVPDDASLDLTSDGSVECWIYMNSTATNQSIISKAPTAYALGVYSSGKLSWGKHSVDEVQSNQTLSSGTWYHIVCTRTAGTDSIYIDGALDVSAAKANFDNTASPLYVGSNNLLPGWYFNGIIDELRVYNRALTASEIALRYNSGTPRYRHDLADIRFVQDGYPYAELPCWQETDGRFWVKVPSLPAGDTVVRMHYGNASATAVSDGDATFDFFDDFSTAWNNPVKWTADTAYGSVTDGVLSFAVPGNENRAMSGAAFSSSMDSAMRARARIPDAFRGAIGLVNSVNGHFARFFTYQEAGKTLLDSMDGTTWSTAASNWTQGAFKLWDVAVTAGTSARFYESGAELAGSPKTNNVPNDFLTATLYSNQNTVYVDWILVRKCSAVEPTHSAPGP